MKFSRSGNRATALLGGLCLALLLPAANAVIKNVAIVGTDGQPVAEATVTIVFPDGTEAEAENKR